MRFLTIYEMVLKECLRKNAIGQIRPEKRGVVLIEETKKLLEILQNKGK